MFRIGDFSRLTQVTVKALRHYDDLGLLKPAHVDPVTGYRSYAGAQVPRLNRILALKDLGLSLEQIGEFLDSDLSPTQLRALLLVKQAETQSAIAAEEERLARIEARLRQIEFGSEPPYDVVVKRIAAQRVASIRRVIPSRTAIGSLFRELFLYQQRHDLTVTDRIVIWHDPDFRETQIDAEAAFATADPLPPDDHVRAGELPSVETMASVVYRGPVSGIGQACQAVLGWIETNGYQIAGPERGRSIERGARTGEEDVVELQYPITKVRAPASAGETGDATRGEEASEWLEAE
jgi:DNA-binding transcriptional MerR regulator